MVSIANLGKYLLRYLKVHIAGVMTNGGIFGTRLAVQLDLSMLKMHNTIVH